MTLQSKWRLSGILVIIALLTSAWVYGQSTIVAEVNGRAILRTSFVDALEDRNGHATLNQLIIQELIEQEARRKNIVVSPEDIDEEIANVRNNFTSEQQFLIALAQHGMTIEDLREQTKYTLMLEKLRTQDIEISEDKVNEYYNENKDEFVVAPIYKISHIQVSSEEKAENILKELEDGKDFGTMAEESSEDENTRSSHGYIGAFEQKDLPSNFKDSVVELDEGAFSGVIESSYGYHIVELTEKVDERQLSLDEAREYIERSLKLEQAMPENEYIGQLADEAQIRIVDNKYEDLIE